MKNNEFTSSTLYIADLLTNVQANPRSGSITIQEHELPGASSIAGLETLRDDYGWTFSYSLATKSAKTMGVMFSEDFIKESLKNLK
ncbi:MAG: hypothetical protein JXB49_35510 [Bacteroidales bacterium]|nr:hypothetical protein [Bacteroidales bacterium]